jgi:hypothetical protein
MDETVFARASGQAPLVEDVDPPAALINAANAESRLP